MGSGDVEVESVVERERMRERRRERSDEMERGRERREKGGEERRSGGREIADEVNSERDWDWRERKGERRES
jgi:hypothetical protein